MWKRFLAWLRAEDIEIPQTLVQQQESANKAAERAVLIFNNAARDLELAANRLDEIAATAFAEAEALAEQAREAVAAAKSNQTRATKIKELLA